MNIPKGISELGRKIGLCAPGNRARRGFGICKPCSERLIHQHNIGASTVK